MSNKSDIKILNVRPDEVNEKNLELHLKEEQLREQAKDARELFSTIQDELERREEDLKDGLSFLDMKNDTLLSYMIDVCNIVLRKVRDEKISGHQSVERCVEYRVTLEKIKAIDQKLAYQLNKLISLPEDAEEDQKLDVRNLDIDLDNVETDAEGDEDDDSKGDDDDDEDEEDDDDDEEIVSDGDEREADSGSDFKDSDDSNELDGKVGHKVPLPPKSKSKKPTKGKTGASDGGVYKPPKLRSVAYTEEGDYKRGNKGRRKNYDDFYQDEEPGDITEKTRLDVDEDRVRFEEENYTRLPDDNPKKAKRKLKTREYKRKGNKRMKRRR